jgi:zinc transport system permease protein
MGLGEVLFEWLSPYLKEIGKNEWGLLPGEFFPSYFLLEYFHRPFIASIIVAIVAGFLGTFLLIRNLALIGDGLAHVSFGAIVIGLIFGGLGPLWYALAFCTLAAVLIDELQARGILDGDAAIAIFMTGMLGLGLVIMRIWGGTASRYVDGYLYGDLLLVDQLSFDIIVTICVIGYLFMLFLYHSLLSISIDPIAAMVQGLPVRLIRLFFSIITAAIVVSMVQIVGALLVTALIVAPAATAQLFGKSFRSCVILSQIIGVITVIIGLYFSAEYDTGSGSMIALVAACIFGIALILQTMKKLILKPNEN